jgi:hypothetical protein
MTADNVLVFKAPDGSKRDLELSTDDETTIGRHPDCTLTVGQPSVSRRHARLWCDAGAWFVEDLQSSNGTYINNRRINKAPLSEGDEVRCGDFVLTYVIHDGGASAGPPPPPTTDAPPPPPIPPRIVGKLSMNDEQPPPPPIDPGISDRATVGLSDPEEAENVLSQIDANEEVDGLLSEIEDWKAKAQAAEDKAQAAEGKVEAAEAQAQAAQDDAQTANEKAEVAEEKAEAAQEKAQAAEEKAEEAPVDDGQESRIKGLEADLDGLRKVNEELRSTVEEAAANAAAASEDSDQVDALKAELAVAEEARVAAEQSRDDAQNAQSEAEDALRQAQEDASRENEGLDPALMDLSNDLDDMTGQLRNNIVLASGFLKELTPIVDATEELRKEGLPGKVGATIRAAVEETDGAQAMSAAQTAMDQNEKLARGLRRLSRLFKEWVESAD